ncbi:MAG: BlaI/MecI/CopY family transcriptional regulator [Rhodothermales bacterium]|nr:BlaI/MecI/CopY family transcriptional regulator [Rhodothermales bacterium]MBO6779991.1 BlaI/MecI/CopY family transcriptional regulator [Rhodothermales bacterium]
MNNKRLPPNLGDTEMEVLNLVWHLKRASVAEIHDRIAGQRPVAYTTVMTVMRKLADKGYLGFTKKGNAYIYHPLVEEQSVRSNLLQRLLHRAFSGSPMELVQTLVAEESFSQEEIEELDRLIGELRKREESE